MFDISSAQWDDDGIDNARWSIGNVFVSPEQAEQARDKITEVLLPFHEEQR